MRRRGRFSFTDDSPESSRAICFYCKDEFDTIVKLVEYKPDSHFKLCPECGKIIDKNRMTHESITEPLGSLVGKKPTFEIAETRRRIKRTSSFEPTEEEVPLLNGKRDRDLESLLSEHNGILVSVSDDNVDMEEQEY